MAVIDPTAVINETTVIQGDSYIGPGVIINDSYLENITVEAGAVINDCIIQHNTNIRTHACDTAGRYITGGGNGTIASQAEITSSTLLNCSVGSNCRISECALEECTIGADNQLSILKAGLLRTGNSVTITGPTEFSEAWVGDGAVFNQCGYLEGVFSDEFSLAAFNSQTGRIEIRETLTVPHVSRYGMNVIDSTNSGKIFPQPDDKLNGMGKLIKPWTDPFLSHEPVMLSPCCWVSGWTKVIGLSVKPHPDPRALLEDTRATYLMPFALAGYKCDAVKGRIPSGEYHCGPRPHQRHSGWVFTHAPQAVIAMVQRLIEAGADSDFADASAEWSIKNALAVLEFERAALQGNNQHIQDQKQWLQSSQEFLQALLDAGIWKFSGGEPEQWINPAGQWQPRDPQCISRIAPDALDHCITERELLDCDYPPLKHRLGINASELSPNESFIDPQATIAEDAEIGPGVSIRGASIIESGAELFNTVIENSTVGADTQILRASISDSQIVSGSRIISSQLSNSSIGANSTIESARIEESALAAEARIAPFSDFKNVTSNQGVILGGTAINSDFNTWCMSMHMAGIISGLKVLPIQIKLDGTMAELRPVPMIGGGARIEGTIEAPVTMEAAFIGSNALIKAGTHIGFGSFVLGKLDTDEGLPPFTASFAPGPDADRIGAVLDSFANMLITHIVGWGYQCGGLPSASAIAVMMNAMIQRGKNFMTMEIERRQTGAPPSDADFQKCTSLAHYSDAQLQSGLEAYSRAGDGRWDMAYTDQELRFCGPGVWQIINGAAQWLPDKP